MDDIKKPKCPYLSTISQKKVQCSLHAVFKNNKIFETEAKLRQYLDTVCYKDFDTCETYRKIYIEQMLDQSPYQKQYKKHAYCCHNSGYVGLKEHDGSTHGYCQLHQKDVELYAAGICEYFNKLYREGECPYYNGKTQDGRKPQIRCGYDTLFTCFGEDTDARDRRVEEVCKGEYINCRPFLIRQLERMGAGPEEKEENQVIYPEQKCKSKNTECGYYCVHNEGCALVLAKGDALKTWMQHVGKVDCGVWREVSGTVQTSKEVPAENTALEASASNTVQAFDYSTVDKETAEFLQEKAIKINRIKVEAKLKIAVELEETFAKFAKLPYGNRTELFDKWVESIGFSPRSARNYISGLEWVRKNFPNIEDAMDIQFSLLIEASKPSAPKELQQAIISGDITTHKQYKELEAKLKAEEDRRKAAEKKLKDAEERAERAINQKFVAENKAIEAEQRCRKAEKDRDDSIRAFERDINNLRQQLEQAKRNGDPEKVRELGRIISEKQQEIESLRRQLKEKPIEATAVREVVKEIIPDEIRTAIITRVESALLTVDYLTDAELKMFAENMADFAKEEYAEKVDEIIERLNFLKSLLVTEVIEDDDYTGNCGMCKYADMDRVTEEQLEENKTWCTLEDVVVDFEHYCTRFEMVGT